MTSSAPIYSPISQRDSPQKHGVTGAPFTTYIRTIDVICRDIKRNKDSSSYGSSGVLVELEKMTEEFRMYAKKKKPDYCLKIMKYLRAKFQPSYRILV